ncbi:hypothetical protein DXX93_12255 [Thalassotalea euphylliae]|uniref:PepSY domain-containing protein n=1 Tax=Thalassotalea euphylliae TaxID=1655234 RepID=A0A3E0TTF6_9GAMM|nr:hypothetical protein [Thalassotalea euphylliae]REL27262.1 hypothetical protein DXX93_12255 [Thalassotalea euphylliae]
MRWIRTTHKWLSLLLALQVLLWLLSGLYFNVMDSHKARGNTYRASSSAVQALHQPSDIDINQLIAPNIILGKTSPATDIQLTQLLGEPIYIVRHKKGLYRHFVNHYSLFHAYTGEPFSLDESHISQIAKVSYSGQGDMASVSYFKSNLPEFPHQQNPSWQVNFADELATSVYIEAATGRVIGHSDQHKRLTDIAFMLHFIDYGKSGNFNHGLIIFFALCFVWLAISGVTWSVQLAAKGEYRIGKKRS